MPASNPTPNPAAGETVLVELPAAVRDTVAGALRDQADRYRRAGIRAAGEAADVKRRGSDIRTRAVKVVEILAEADRLTLAADAVDAAETRDPADVTVTRRTVDVTPPPPSPAEDEEGSIPEDLDGATADDIAEAMGQLGDTPR